MSSLGGTVDPLGAMQSGLGVYSGLTSAASHAGSASLAGFLGAAAGPAAVLLPVASVALNYFAQNKQREREEEERYRQMIQRSAWNVEDLKHGLMASRANMAARTSVHAAGLKSGERIDIAKQDAEARLAAEKRVFDEQLFNKVAGAKFLQEKDAIEFSDKMRNMQTQISALKDALGSLAAVRHQTAALGSGAQQQTFIRDPVTGVML